MGRIYSRGRGISKSAYPYKRTLPKWVRMNASQIEERICNLAKRGMPPSKIGAVLRDVHSVGPHVVRITGNKILRVLKCHGLAPAEPEELTNTVAKAKRLRRHLSKNRKDKASKFRLLLVESHVHRLVRYFKKVKQLPASYQIYIDCSGVVYGLLCNLLSGN